MIVRVCETRELVYLVCIQDVLSLSLKSKVRPFAYSLLFCCHMVNVMIQKRGTHSTTIIKYGIYACFSKFFVVSNLYMMVSEKSLCHLNNASGGLVLKF